jgi:hypothetical protein
MMHADMNRNDDDILRPVEIWIRYFQILGIVQKFTTGFGWVVVVVVVVVGENAPKCYEALHWNVGGWRGLLRMLRNK